MKEQQKGGERRDGVWAGAKARISGAERPPPEKLTLDTIALASSTVFFKTCFIFSFGAIRKKRTDNCQTHVLFQNPGCS